ncbi:hypothetical protein GCM10010919_04950 [Alishewanella longhuensis]|uniref:DUF2459 domain-containing protein n=1 Tax=Alishewanella longhuensis TaxID=1091037 RepID=A0ABQ3KUL1_9ALTE|nr:DUF2459 domain-containing protein [Alishewanella longhuensis]GHG60963.1 hypothetical protein GCM10010919_04950 [Alishewanella longhuensis]
MKISTVFIVLLLLPLISGCSAIISAPETVYQPREVQLLQHGRHSSLLLTAADQSRLRYSFGDWAWYVESDQSLASGSRALFKDSKGALGRQIVAPTTAGENLAAKVGVGIGQAYLFQVEAAQVDALIKSLEQQFTASQSVPFYSAERHLSFVPHSRPYSYSYNSNHQAADWLRALGLQVQGNPAWGNWRVKDSTTAKNH